MADLYEHDSGPLERIRDEHRDRAMLYRVRADRAEKARGGQ